MVNMGIERLQKLVQQPPSEYASTNRDKESAMAATNSENSAETRYRTRGCKKDRKGRRQRHRSRTPSMSPSRSPSRYRSRSRPRRSGSRKPNKQDIDPTSCPHCKEYGGYGLAHDSPKNVPHDKCNYNKKWKGWRPEWFCKKIGISYKEHDDCKERHCGDLDEEQSSKESTEITRCDKITKTVAPYYVHLSNAYAQLEELSADLSLPTPEHKTRTTINTNDRNKHQSKFRLKAERRRQKYLPSTCIR